jgi:nucleolar protein 14
MTAAEDSSEEDDEESEKPSKEKPRSLSGDDLGDSFSVDEETMTKKGWVDEILERRDEEEGSSSEDDDGEDSDDSERSEDSDEGSEDDLDENDKNTTLKDWEQSDDDDISAGSEDEDDDISAGSEDEDEDEERAAEEVDKVKRLNVGIHKKAKRNDSVESVKGDNGSLNAKKIVIGGKMSKELDIPYIIEAPKTFEELCSLVDKRSNSDTILIINRIRKSNPITLAAENRKKVQVRNLSLY